MKNIKRTFLQAFFVIEAVIFGFMYIFGTHGLKAMSALHRSHEQLDKEIVQLNKEVIFLEQEIVAWQSDPFYQEKIARERLHMARAGDVIFYVS